MTPDSVAKNVTTTNAQEQPDPEPYPDQAIAETGDEPDIASIERIYRYAPSIPHHPPIPCQVLPANETENSTTA